MIVWAAAVLWVVTRYQSVQDLVALPQLLNSPIEKVPGDEAAPFNYAIAKLACARVRRGNANPPCQLEREALDGWFIRAGMSGLLAKPTRSVGSYDPALAPDAVRFVGDRPPLGHIDNVPLLHRQLCRLR
jgi:hypothetical protein